MSHPTSFVGSLQRSKPKLASISSFSSARCSRFSVESSRLQTQQSNNYHISSYMSQLSPWPSGVGPKIEIHEIHQNLWNPVLLIVSATCLNQWRWQSAFSSVCVLAYRCLHGSAPQYLAETLHLTSDTEACRRLRSGSTSTLFVPATRRFSLCDRAFPVAAARSWNTLLVSLRTVSSYLTFRRELKTFLFNISFPDNWTVCVTL